MRGEACFWSHYPHTCCLLVLLTILDQATREDWRCVRGPNKPNRSCILYGDPPLRLFSNIHYPNHVFFVIQQPVGPIYLKTVLCLLMLLSKSIL
ncbi:hypothetical protein F5Y03DRAFT_360246 [Xylaria venustula]|nr:hypothetical protein F5Y03DRAFT_360246 [Xylaria venustula]